MLRSDYHGIYPERCICANQTSHVLLDMKCPEKGNVREFLESLCMKHEELATVSVKINTKDYLSTIISSLPTSLSNFTSNLLAAAKLYHMMKTLILMCSSPSSLKSMSGSKFSTHIAPMGSLPRMMITMKLWLHLHQMVGRLEAVTTGFPVACAGTVETKDTSRTSAWSLRSRRMERKLRICMLSGGITEKNPRKEIYELYQWSKFLWDQSAKQILFWRSGHQIPVSAKMANGFIKMHPLGRNSSDGKYVEGCSMPTVQKTGLCDTTRHMSRQSCAERLKLKLKKHAPARCKSCLKVKWWGLFHPRCDLYPSLPSAILPRWLKNISSRALRRSL